MENNPEWQIDILLEFKFYNQSFFSQVYTQSSNVYAFDQYHEIQKSWRHLAIPDWYSLANKRTPPKKKEKKGKKTKPK